jgi:hypothetical protein
MNRNTRRALAAGIATVAMLGMSSSAAAGAWHVRTTVGPAEPLTPADQIALYGHRAPVETSRRRRGCKTAHTRAKYYNHGAFAYWLDFRSRFCFDRRKRKAVQRGFQSTDTHIAPGFDAAGYSVKDDEPIGSVSQRWHGARKGMTRMQAKFKLENRPRPAPFFSSSWTIIICQHGHYDGTVYDHQWKRD